MTLIIIFSILALSTSCEGNKNADEIEKELSSGVVLIQNKSFYEAQFPNGKSLYFSSYDTEDGISGLTADLDSVVPALSYGTGFFISDDGKIATNHHVVADLNEEKEITKTFSEIFDAIKEALSDEYNEMYSKYQRAAMLAQEAAYDPYTSYQDYELYCLIRDAYDEELSEYRELYSQIDKMKPDNSKIIYHNELAIGYNDTFVTNESDLHSCIFRNSNKDKDLAIIQLKEKATPAGKHVFSISGQDPLEEYNLSDKIWKTFGKDKNSQIYMPAFNLGPALAITDEGLKLQFGSGSVSRKTNDDIMYTIPSLPGSSGSPIVNQKGEVIAVNAAGIRGSDSFNSGVRIKHLHKLLSEL